jgi:hypothetical protein
MTFIDVEGIYFSTAIDKVLLITADTYGFSAVTYVILEEYPQLI